MNVEGVNLVSREVAKAMTPTTRHGLPCSICNVPTDGLWMDRALCDGCLDEMAEELSPKRFSDPVYDYDGTSARVAAYIAEAREKLAEAYWDSHDEMRYEHP